ncbi:MAG: HAMP domain-containing sensor histidine kinase [Pseudomonadota bacterium]
MLADAGSAWLEPTADGANDRSDLDEVLYHLTHDVRAPAKALAMLSEWVGEDLGTEVLARSPEVAQHLADMRVQASRLDRMLADLAAYARIGRPDAQDEVLDLADLVRGLAKDQDQDQDQRREPGTQMTLHLALEISTIKAPRVDLSAILAALLDNAARHHDRPTGHVTITSTVDAGGTIVLSLTDDGPGIPAAQQHNVFSLMTTLRSRDEVDTSGVGLALVRKGVARLGGTVAIAPAIAPAIMPVPSLADSPRGTRVEIRLPAARAAQHPPGHPPGQPEPQHDTPSTGQQSNQKTGHNTT